MSVTVPLFQVGKNVSAMSVTPQNVSAVGVLTAGTPFDLHTLGIFDSYSYKASYGGVEISPLDGVYENYVGTKGTFDFSIGEIVQNGMYSVLMNAWQTSTSPYYRFAAASVVGAVTNQLVIIATTAGGSIDYAIVEGKQGVVMALKPCGIVPWYGAGTPPI